MNGINPFPSSAIAQVSTIGGDVVTIPTPAIERATEELQGYLDAGRERQGKVLTIVGEYGMGKTHLAVHLMDVARQASHSYERQIYLKAPAAPFTELYRSFAAEIEKDRDIVAARVRQLYAEVVADDLTGSGLYDEIVRRLRDGTADPVEVVRAMSLPEGRFLERVQQRLQGVTENKAFGTALTLLLRPGFEDAVWEWLTGKEPDESLRERGITDATTATERSALDAMGVFALLISHDRHRFMVVVDELDQLLGATGRPQQEVQAALKQLFSSFITAGAFLVLVGLPDLLSVLRADVRARVNREVRMSALTRHDAERYIRARQDADTLSPFNTGTVEYIVDVAAGSPRTIIQMCYLLYQRATDQGGDVTDAMVRAVVSEMNFANLDAVRRDIRRILKTRGLVFVEDRWVDEVRVQYWITAGGDEAIALLVRSAVQDETALAELTTAAERLRQSENHAVLVILGGYLEPRYAERLRAALELDPIVYERRVFAERLEDALRYVETRLRRGTGDAEESYGRLSRQQATMLDAVLQLADQIEDLATSNERRMSELTRRVDLIGTPAPSGREARPAVAAAPVLPAGVVEVFEKAENSLSLGDRLEALQRRAFDEDPDAAMARRMVTRLLRQQRVAAATGYAAFLQRFTEAFRRHITDWYASAPTGHRLTNGHRERLGTIAKIFETVLASVPLYEIGWLSDQLSLGEATASGVLGDRVRSQQIQDVFAELPARVQSAVLSGFDPA
jgi:Cdc6-like AAA superfamily ATPase